MKYYLVNFYKNQKLLTQRHFTSYEAAKTEIKKMPQKTDYVTIYKVEKGEYTLIFSESYSILERFKRRLYGND